MAWLVKILLSFGLEKLVNLLTYLIKKHRQNVEFKSQAKDSLAKLNAAKTKEEIDESTRSALDGF